MHKIMLHKQTCTPNKDTIYSVKADFTMQNYSLIYIHVLPVRVIYSDDVFSPSTLILPGRIDI